MWIRYMIGVAIAAVAAIGVFLLRPGDARSPDTPASVAESVIEVARGLVDIIHPPGDDEPELPPPEPPQPLVVFGSIPYWDQARAIASFKRHVADIDAIAVFWYRLNADGTIAKYTYAVEDQALLQFARQRDVNVYALIANLPENADWDPERVAAAIGTPEKRAAHIAEIVAFAKEKKFDGINIDYEFLSDSQMDDYTAFINELGAALHKEGKLLKIAIHAQRAGSETRGQDLSALTGADYLSFMTYDQHWETSDPGANAEIGWMREVLSYAKSRGVSMRKVVVGIPLDGYNWLGEDGEWGEADGVDYTSVLKLANEEGADIEYDSSVEAPHFSFGNSDGTENEVWFEDVRSFEPKYNLAKEFGLAGIALWKFGGEDERIYEVIE